MNNKHETMYDGTGDTMHVDRRTRKGNYMGTLRLRGRTF